ncbi:sterol desaturase family protein [Dongia sp.]|uniref:sterol desaturase family protein n=1 Tax=Dongia sp. TaxID=1977262 RepID=UPI0035B42D66
MNEALFRLGLFLIVFALIGLAEVWRPRRPLAADKTQRWRTNLGLFLINVVAQRLTVGAIVLGVALLAGEKGWGLFNLLVLPRWAEALPAILLLDLAIYAQHVATHLIPPLWRLHKVHHADLDVDLTTGLRFHPIEILLSALWKAAIVLALGVDPLIVLVYEALLNAFALFTHGNVAMPERWDRHLRRIFATPDMHRRHHSTQRDETDSNYGNIFSLWDRLFGTYFAAPALGQMGVILGLAEARKPEKLTLLRLLAMPFR